VFAYEIVSTRATRSPLVTNDSLPRQIVGGGKFIQKRLGRRHPLFANLCFEGKLTFGDPFQASGVVRSPLVREGFSAYHAVESRSKILKWYFKKGSISNPALDGTLDFIT
jgi:hypothetical protein